MPPQATSCPRQEQPQDQGNRERRDDQKRDTPALTRLQGQRADELLEQNDGRTNDGNSTQQ
jgi:hypothetical protein